LILFSYWEEKFNKTVSKNKQGNGENYILRSLVICTTHQILFGWSNREELDGWDM